MIVAKAVRTSAGKAVKPVRAARAKIASKTPDAIAFLRADHRRVAGLFSAFDKARTAGKKRQLLSQICTELSVHAQIEEEIFYPAVKLAGKGRGRVAEAAVEHIGISALVAQLEAGEFDEAMFDAKVSVLAKYVKSHFRDEQTLIFAHAKNSKQELVLLGTRLAARQAELTQQREVDARIRTTAAAFPIRSRRVVGGVPVLRADGIDFPHGS